MLVSSPWHCKMCSRFASKRGGGDPKAVLLSSGGAQNCASKLRVTILLRDPLTIPADNRQIDRFVTFTTVTIIT